MFCLALVGSLQSLKSHPDDVTTVLMVASLKMKDQVFLELDQVRSSISSRLGVKFTIHQDLPT